MLRASIAAHEDHLVRPARDGHVRGCMDCAAMHATSEYSYSSIVRDRGVNQGATPSVFRREVQPMLGVWNGTDGLEEA